MNLGYEIIAANMKKEIDRELGITVTVGMSLTKVLAKVASKHQKPNGMTIISVSYTHLTLPTIYSV